MTDRPTVFVVDDSAAVRRSLESLLAAEGIPIETYASSEAFLAAYDPPRPGCLLLDLRLRGESGLDLQDELRRREADLPIIVVTAHGTVPASVRALKAGAIDFLEKPVPPRRLIERIRDALAIAGRRRAAQEEQSAHRAHLERLTPREREVMDLLVAGRTSKEIATELRLSVRTVEGHRREVLRKMEVSSAAKLVRSVLSARA